MEGEEGGGGGAPLTVYGHSNTFPREGGCFRVGGGGWGQQAAQGAGGETPQLRLVTHGWVGGSPWGQQVRGLESSILQRQWEGSSAYTTHAVGACGLGVPTCGRRRPKGVGQSGATMAGGRVGGGDGGGGGVLG